jgi:hypothetical protein
MALLPLQPGLMPLGQFDVLDTDQANIRGGEVMTLGLASRTNTATEKAAADVLDGYNFATPTAQRAVAQLATSAVNLVYLSDGGTGPDYFTLFGTLTGATAGLVTSGSALGPNNMSGSGKVTLWDKPGLYAVTTNALHANFASTITSAGLTPGSVIGYDSAGKLAHSTANGAISASGVAYFVEFGSSGSYVTTPARLVGATAVFDRIKIQFHSALGVRTVSTNPA